MRKFAGTTAITLTAFGALPGPTASATDPIRRIGSLNRPSETTYGANGNILLDPVRRRGYQATVADDTKITEYDLDSMSVVHVMHIPPLQPAQTATGPMDWLWSLDAKHGRLFAFQAEAPDDQTRLSNYMLLVTDVVHHRALAPIKLWQVGDRVPLALSYDPAGDRLLILTQSKAQVFGHTTITLEARDPDGTAVWERREPQCHGAMDSQYPPSLWRSLIQPQYVYFNCYNQSLVQAQVVRVHLTDGAPDGEQTFPAVPGALSTLHDPGSDRFYFLTTNSGAGRGAWVFDGLRSSFLGVIASGDNRVGATAYAMGIDATTGRLYMQSAAGLIVADARRTPLPGGLLFRQYAGRGVGIIQVDSATHHIFVPDPRTLSDVGRAESYAIFSDEIPLSHDPRPGAPDQFTTDIAEAKEVTDASWSGSARAFGVRTLMTGGVQRNVWNAALGQFPPDDPTSPIFLQAWQQLSAVPVDAGGRETMFGRVRSATLTKDSADVAARAIDIDPGTERDVQPHGGWPIPTIECHDPGNRADTEAGTAGTVSTTCDVGNRIVMASAGAPPILTGGVGVRSAFSMGTSTVDKRGSTTRAVAIAKDVNLFDLARIGVLQTEAETWAHGRPGTASGRFIRTFANVSIDANKDGVPEFSCARTCDADAVVAALNVALAGIALVAAPEPDSAWYPKGSAGGYQAVIEKERFRGYSERALNDDDTVEVAGLQIVSYTDGYAGRTRQVVQLAGVQAESHYGIYLLPQSDHGFTPAPQPTVAPPATRTTTAVIAPPIAHHKVTPKQRQVIDRIVDRVALGAGIAFVNPSEALRLAVLWSFLAIPGYLVWRRRLLGGAR